MSKFVLWGKRALHSDVISPLKWNSYDVEVTESSERVIGVALILTWNVFKHNIHTKSERKTCVSIVGQSMKMTG